MGITTGKTFCGDVGSSARREYALVGDIVNLSARLMVAAKTYVLCDFDTYEASKNSKKIKFERLEDIRVKGKANPIAIFQPSKAKVTPGGQSNIQNTQQDASGSSLDNKTIIGRTNEMKVIRHLVSGLVSQSQTTSSTQVKRSSLTPTTVGAASATVAKPKVLIVDGIGNYRFFFSLYMLRIIVVSVICLKTNTYLFVIIEGVGKSRLVRHLESMVRDMKNKVLIGYGDQLRYNE